MDGLWAPSRTGWSMGLVVARLDLVPPGWWCGCPATPAHKWKTLTTCATTRNISTTHPQPSSAPGAELTAPPELRIDALNNRNRIVEAARESLAALGLDVPMAVIARSAGVGMATLYRRFPTKEVLVTEVFADQIHTRASAVDDALADPDPWRGFRTFIGQAGAMQAADRGFTVAFTSAFRARAVGGFAVLVQRAKDSGQLRPDFVQDDFISLLMANSAGLTEFPRSVENTDAALTRPQRLVAYLLLPGRPRPSTAASHPAQCGPLVRPASGSARAGEVAGRRSVVRVPGRARSGLPRKGRARRARLPRRRLLRGRPPTVAAKLCETVSIVMLMRLKTRPIGCVNAAMRRSSKIFGQHGGASIPPWWIGSAAGRAPCEGRTDADRVARH